jgi:glycosyltransferase involved in cell wall biosynthesis
METNIRPRIVLSGVNFTGMGPLSVFKDAIISLAAGYSHRYEIIALVHSKLLFDVPNITYIEYPKVKSSWFRRLYFEYYECLRLSKSLTPDLWFAMHDMTPNVQAKTRAVYCHNPAPFYSFRVKEALLDRRFGLFILFYDLLYRFNIRANDFVVVQQEWLREEFRARYGVQNIVVAHPSTDSTPADAIRKISILENSFRFFYPAFPRTFKNIEQLLNAVRILERSGFDKFELWLTTDGTENRYAECLLREYSDLKTVRWLGLLPRTKVLELYGESNCLVFPSRLESWGMPITEFKATGRPILAIDLPYAHETIGEYGQAAFFESGNSDQLATKMREAVMGREVFFAVEERPIELPFSRNWEGLWKILLSK